MLAKQVEALLFSAGRKMDLRELSALTRSKVDKVKEALVELKDRYDDGSSLMLVNEGDFWKLAVREQHLPLVRSIVTETELSKTVMETLAVIAFKYPIKQSDLIAIRTNKAYDHLKELQELGYITRQKHGRTNLIKLTQKFFEYFDLREEQLKDKFKDFKSIAHAIESKEKEIEDIRQQQQEQAKSEQTVEQTEAKIQEEIDSLEEYDTDSVEVTKEEEKLGNLEVVDEPSEGELEAERERIQDIKDDKKSEETVAFEEKEQQAEESSMNSEEEPEKKHESQGIEMNANMEQAVDKKVEEILHPKSEEESSEDDDQSESEEKEEETDLLEAAMQAEQKQKEQKKKDKE